MNQPGDESKQTAFEARCRALLEQSTDALDARTRSRLAQARQAALAEVERGRTVWFLRWAPATGVAAAAALAILVSAQLELRPAQESAPLLLEDFDLVAEAENLEMLEDMEFYAWLESATDETAAGDQSG